MDKLDQHISDKEVELSEVEARAATLRAEIKALYLAASLRPASRSSSTGNAKAPSGTRGRTTSGRTTSGTRGRTIGSISKEWRAILFEVFKADGCLKYEDIHDIAARLGNDVALSSIRVRIRNMVKTGLLKGDQEIGFYVTDEAVERFEFKAENSEPSGSEEPKTGSAYHTSGFHNFNPSET